MGKRKRPTEVPRALHTELTEYASLLRALSSNDTADVVQTISQARQKRQRREESTPPPEVAEGSAQPAAEQEEGQQPKKKKKKKPPRKEPDIWTRWPVLTADLQMPEFGLDQELETLMRQFLRSNADPSDDDDAILDDDALFCVPHLVESASNLLSSLLALISHHTPARTQSLQDRLNPFDWHAVIDMVASCGLVDATELSNVKARMEAIYGPYDSPAISRIEMRAAARSRVAAALEEGDDLLFEFARPIQEGADNPLLDFTRPTARRPARDVAEEEEIDSDDLDS